jgi:hypothetical protein
MGKSGVRMNPVDALKVGAATGDGERSRASTVSGQ